MKRAMLLLACLLAALLLTGCHVDHDPWPTDGVLATVPATATPAPTAYATPVYAEPTATPIMPEPTEVPGGSVEPGFNG